MSTIFSNDDSYFSATFPFEQANDEEFYATWPSFQSPSSAYAEITQDSVTTAETFLTREDFNGPGSLLPPHPDDANRQVEWDLIAGHFPPEDEPAPLFTTVNPAVLSPPLLLPTTSSKSASKTKKTQGRGSRAGRRDRALPVSAVLLDAAPPSKNITGHDVGSAPAVVVSPQAAERRLEGDAEPSIALPADDAQGTKKRKRGEEEKEKEAVFVAAPDVVIIAPANMTAEQKKALNAMRTHVVVEALSGNAEKRGMTRKDLDTFVRMYQDLNLPETAWDYTVRTEFIRTYYGALFSQYMRVVVPVPVGTCAFTQCKDGHSKVRGSAIAHTWAHFNRTTCGGGCGNTFADNGQALFNTHFRKSPGCEVIHMAQADATRPNKRAKKQ